MVERRNDIPSANIDPFLKDLGEVSYRHGIAINGHGHSFQMEGDDYESRYWLTPDGHLEFGA